MRALLIMVLWLTSDGVTVDDVAVRWFQVPPNEICEVIAARNEENFERADNVLRAEGFCSHPGQQV